MKLKLTMLVSLLAIGFAGTAIAGNVADQDLDGVPDAFDNCDGGSLKNQNGPAGGGCTAQQNADGDLFQSLDVSDLTFLVDYLFRSGPAPWCIAEGNADGGLDEQINVADVTYMVDYLFGGGPQPPACP